MTDLEKLKEMVQHEEFSVGAKITSGNITVQVTDEYTYSCNLCVFVLEDRCNGMNCLDADREDATDILYQQIN